ncbi:hypothetical protein OAM67_01340 [bacterium]|nr:hypothetical protein [bacterium]
MTLLLTDDPDKWRIRFTNASGRDVVPARQFSRYTRVSFLFAYLGKRAPHFCSHTLYFRQDGKIKWALRPVRTLKQSGLYNGCCVLHVADRPTGFKPLRTCNDKRPWENVFHNRPACLCPLEA